MKIEYPVRLQVYLAKSGCGSRRFCEKLIEAGRVMVNMKTVTKLGTKVDEEDAVMVDATPVEPVEKSYYYLLNKPRGYVCANSDNFNHSYARDLIDVPERTLLFHIGRLDKDSTGLIIYTNDGDLANKVMHPSHGIEKEYLVQVNKPINSNDLKKMQKGVYLDNPRPYRIKRGDIITKRLARIILSEGKNREIRKLFEHFEYEVKQLQRIRIANIELGDTRLGTWRKLTPQEVAGLYKEAGK